MKVILSLIYSLLVVTAFAQTGKISGKVINSKSGEVLIGASVLLDGQSRSSATDLNGSYSFSNLPAGTYSITVSFISYSTKTVPGIIVKANDVTDITIALDEATAENKAVVVKATRTNRENTAALLILQKNSANTSDGISAEAIRKTPDRNTSDVIKRISGASIQDDKFVIIRGLADRYNAAFLNGAPLPSSESDRKAFAFDIFPSNVLENIVIYKTATPDLSGEFGGGIINITSKSIPSQNFTTFSLSAGVNTIATFKHRTGYTGGKMDWAGLDDGSRAIPKGLPSIAAFNNLTGAEKAPYAKLFYNKWGLTSGQSFPYTNAQFAAGRNYTRHGKDFFGLLVSLSYNKNPGYSRNEKYSWEYDREFAATPPVNRNRYLGDLYFDRTLAGVMVNLSLKPSDKSTISLKNMVSVNSENKLLLRSGYLDYEGDQAAQLQTNGRWFTSNVIYTSQLIGNHILNKSNFRLDWEVAFSKVTRSIPDLRQSVYSIYNGGTPVADVASSTVAADNGGTHFYSTTDEKIYSGKLDFTQPFKFMGSKQSFFKFGGYYQKRDRDFDARLVGFSRYTSGGVRFDNTLLTLPEDKIFAPENLGGVLPNGKGGFSLADGTKPNYNYDASSTLYAGYVMADQRFGNGLRVIYGVRVESYKQILNSFFDYDKPVNINTSKTDFLPSINLVYALNAKQNLRASYSQTINRPEFRELAPFTFFDFVTRYTTQGDTSLVRTMINNYDLRYEIYPGRGQLFSVSGFYKYFTNPIELISSPVNDFTAVYQNAKYAKVFGIEAEVRTLVSTLVNSQGDNILDKLTIAANGSLLWSKIRVGDFLAISAKDLIENRNLQGQSPYLFNGSITYADDKSGFSSALSLNGAGPRIFLVGTVSTVDIYEKPRTSLDFQLAKTFQKDKWELKFNVKDILAQKQTFYYDIDENKKYDASVDKIFLRNSFGRIISLSATYKF